MSLLKKIPVTYAGELHIRLVNFWVDIDEVLPFVPKPLVPRNFDGKALISLVNVELKKMHAELFPVNFSYRHIAFRLLLDDSKLNGGESKGIFFLRSFTDRSEIVLGGNLLTDYRLEKAEIRNLDRMLELRQESNYFHYALDLDRAPLADEKQRKIVGALDRAYAVDGSEVKMVRIMRDKWPLRQVQCYLVETNFFKTARPASAFVVDEVIPYRWQAPQIISSCESSC
jgi:hypothetical protein